MYVCICVILCVPYVCGQIWYAPNIIQGFTGAPFRSCTMMSSGQKSTRNLEQVEYVGLILKPLESHENMFEIQISLGILLLENSYLGNLDLIMIYRVFTRVFFDDGFVGWRFAWSDANQSGIVTLYDKNRHSKIGFTLPNSCPSHFQVRVLDVLICFVGGQCCVPHHKASRTVLNIFGGPRIQRWDVQVLISLLSLLVLTGFTKSKLFPLDLMPAAKAKWWHETMKWLCSRFLALTSTIRKIRKL